MIPVLTSLPASLLVVLIPLAAAALAYLVRRWRTLETLAALLGCSLTLIVLSQPAGATVQLPGFTIEVGGSLNLLGRTLSIQEPDRLPLALLFAATLVVVVLAWRLPQGRLFVPLTLAILALMCAGLMIQPFVYAGLAFEAASALAAILIQSERTGPLSTIGAQRYLVLSTLALPAFLGAGYLISQAT
ncbi:MAG: hypothetical protein RMN25_09470, partial [Anaerolineae bacterium]|nr:hypothetical protein [Thermoflexales bacterium]MDW8407999.1 hypothetical protein [Anaerolineae bacterium]